MTESQAKTKWCPMVRFEIWPDGTIGNNRNKKGSDSMCVGSDCMMWRWIKYDFVKPETGTKEQTRNCEGFCGLAEQLHIN